jgi:hypothetical protein
VLCNKMHSEEESSNQTKKEGRDLKKADSKNIGPPAATAFNSQFSMGPWRGAFKGARDRVLRKMLCDMSCTAPEPAPSPPPLLLLLGRGLRGRVGRGVEACAAASLPPRAPIHSEA